MCRCISHLTLAVPGLDPGIPPATQPGNRPKAGHGDVPGMYKSNRQR